MPVLEYPHLGSDRPYLLLPFYAGIFFNTILACLTLS